MGKLTPGERMQNWASAFMQLWPAWAVVLGALGVTNYEEVRGFIITNDGQKITQLTAFEKYTSEKFDEIDTNRGFDKAELRGEMKVYFDALQAEIVELSNQSANQDTTNYRALAKKIEAIEGKIVKNHGLE